MLKALAPENNYSLTSWESQRDRQIKQTTIPLTIFAIIAGFLIIMVAMGLFGVLWQNVTGRTHEIGLRRALGATAASIHKQIIGELMIVTFIGIAIAFIGLVQLPMLGVFQELDWPLFWVSLLSAMAFMLTLSALCGYYPGKIAIRYSPSQALHYE
jgi:putative ABC transport system permease protein